MRHWAKWHFTTGDECKAEWRRIKAAGEYNHIYGWNSLAFGDGTKYPTKEGRGGTWCDRLNPSDSCFPFDQIERRGGLTVEVELLV